MAHPNQTVSRSAARVATTSKRQWSGRVISTVPILFLTFDAVIKLYATAHNDPAVRARSAKMLRELGPMLDDFAKRQNDRAGFPLVDNGAMTKALVSQLFDKMQ